MEYKVTYEIHVSADTEEDAAQEVEQIMLHPFYRPSLSVTSPSGEVKFIDLDKKTKT